MITLKRYVYPPQLLNILILMTAFILYGAADTGRMSIWIYRGLLLVGVIHFCYAKMIQQMPCGARVFRQNKIDFFQHA